MTTRYKVSALEADGVELEAPTEIDFGGDSIFPKKIDIDRSILLPSGYFDVRVHLGIPDGLEYCIDNGGELCLV